MIQHSREEKKRQVVQKRADLEAKLEKIRQQERKVRERQEKAREERKATRERIAAAVGEEGQEEGYVTAEEMVAEAEKLASSNSSQAHTQPPDDDDDPTVYFAGIANSGPSASSVPDDPTEALNGPDGHHWRAALRDELLSLEENHVYEVVPTPKGVKPITSKMVLRIKLDANGNIECYKIWIVARGFTQREGIDYKDVWAPVANLESICIILALAAKFVPNTTSN